MKQKIALLILVIVIAKSNFAQKTSIGFSGGISIASVHAKESNVSTTTKWKTGITAGVYAVTPLSSNFVFLPSINFVQKGAIPKDLQPDEKEKTTLNYIEVPLNFAYAAHGFMIGAGPSVAMGISGYDKYSSSTQPQEKTKVKFGNTNDDDIKRFDLGANFLTGYQFSNSLMIAANFNLGLSNLIPGDASSDAKAKNNYFGLKIGYTLRSK